MPKAHSQAKAKVARGALLSGALVLASLAFARPASAELLIGEADGWKAYSYGNINAFLSYSFGDAYPNPVPGTNRNIVGGGGLNGAQIPKVDGNGMPIPGAQGTISHFRVRNGFSPNVFGFGVRKKVSDDLQLKVAMSIWGTIEPTGQEKEILIQGDFREGYGQVEGSWGAVTIGRHLGLFSRGIVDMNFRYLHQYGLGFPGNLTAAGPTAGLIGFGVLAAFFSPGIMYTTPSLGGLRINLGVYDGVQIPGSSWEVSRMPRPETEITYDYESGNFKTHLFVNGAYQKLYRPFNAKDEATMVGVGYGGRLEFGPFHFGAGGHYGTGLGLFYALEGGDTSIGPPVVGPGQQEFALRTFDGYSAFFQYAPGQFDINLGVGQSRVHLLEEDKTGPEALNNSVVKTQTGVALGFVWHFSQSVHWDIDYMRGMFRWYKGEKQDVNFVNSGVTLNW